MKKSLLIIILLLSGVIGISQSAKKTFHLKNGSVISGVVIEEIPGKQYKIKNKGWKYLCIQGR